MYGPHGIAFTWSGDTPVGAYDNGVSVGLSSMSKSWVAGTEWGVGSLISSYNGFKGKMFALRLYSRALAAEEVAANYAIDKERFNLP